MSRVTLKVFGLIRIKSGKSIFDVSTAGKTPYTDSKHFTVSKIDIYFVVDIDGKEIDLAADEIANDDSKSKITSDEGKPTRGGKETLLIIS